MCRHWEANYNLVEGNEDRHYMPIADNLHNRLFPNSTRHFLAGWARVNVSLQP